MAFGPQWFPFGRPGLATSAVFTTGQATPRGGVRHAAAGLSMATLIFFQFVFPAAITVIILAGSVLGRMNFYRLDDLLPKEWMTALVYTVGAFSIWGGGWLAGLGVADFSGGYVIHIAAGTLGFVAAAVVGLRLQADRDHFLRPTACW